MHLLHLSRTAPKSCLFLLLACIASRAVAGPTIPLDGPWQFRVDPSNEGTNAGWFRQMPGDTETVEVPHTWGIGKHQDYEGYKASFG